MDVRFDITNGKGVDIICSNVTEWEAGLLPELVKAIRDDKCRVVVETVRVEKLDRIVIPSEED